MKSDISANKAVVRRYIDEVQNGHDIEALESIFSEKFVDHSDTFGGLFKGMAGLKKAMRKC